LGIVVCGSDDCYDHPNIGLLIATEILYQGHGWLVFEVKRRNSMKVNLKDRSIEEYRNIINDEVEKIKELAKPLKGKKVIHVNATAFGGGVAEILQNLAPLMRSVGIDADWYAMQAPNEFFNVTKKFHNTLQGAQIEISEKEWRLYENVCEQNAKIIDENADIVVIHDPQPAAIRLFAKTKPSTKWFWRCHIDLSTPNKVVWNRFAKYLEKYDKMIFHLDEYFPGEDRKSTRLNPVTSLSRMPSSA
jgi:trehalose synthase